MQKCLELIRRARFGERTAGLQIGENDFLGRVENLGRLGHEMNAAKKDDFGIGLGGLKAQPKRIAHKIGDILNLRDLIVMGQNDALRSRFRATISSARSRPKFTPAVTIG